MEIDDFALPAPEDDAEGEGPEGRMVRRVLDAEAVEFLNFVGKAIRERGDGDGQREEEEKMDGEVAFDMLLKPEENTRHVATQGFQHVLTLGTRGLLGVRQEVAFGEIALRLL